MALGSELWDSRSIDGLVAAVMHGALGRVVGVELVSVGSNCTIAIELDGEGTRPKVDYGTDNSRATGFLYHDGEDVRGQVHLKLKKNAKIEHQGIKLEFIGAIELDMDRINNQEFVSLMELLARPGILSADTSYSFHLVNVDKPHETYYGLHCKLRYFLRVTVMKRLSDVVEEQEVIVQTMAFYPETNSSIKMEVGIEDSLHIEFEYNKSKYHMTDVIIGKIYFILVRLKIKSMELEILQVEMSGHGFTGFSEEIVIARHELMDGAPVRGESVPIRIFLGGYDLTPSMRDVNGRFSVKYFVNLVLLDEDDRRYYKKQEIVFYRKHERKTRPVDADTAAPTEAEPLGTLVPTTTTTTPGDTAAKRGTARIPDRDCIDSSDAVVAGGSVK